MTVGVLIEHDGQQMSRASRCVITAAQAFGLPVIALVAGEQVAAVAKEAASCDGVTAVWVADHSLYAHGLAEPLAAWLASLSLTHLLAAANAFGKNVLPRTAALLAVEPIDGVLSITQDKHYVRAMYAGHLLCDVVSTDPIQCLTVSPTAFLPCGEQAPVSMEEHAHVPEQPAVEWVSTHRTPSDAPELASARCVMTIGRGVSPELIPRIQRLASHYQAAIGATRAVVDAGRLPNECQVGQTGQTVAPDVYVAWGVSGAVQHIAGMKHSRVVLSINHDPNAPMRDIADLSLIADIDTVLDEWEGRLAASPQPCYTQQPERIVEECLE